MASSSPAMVVGGAGGQGGEVGDGGGRQPGIAAGGGRAGAGLGRGAAQQPPEAFLAQDAADAGAAQRGALPGQPGADLVDRQACAAQFDVLTADTARGVSSPRQADLHATTDHDAWRTVPLYPGDRPCPWHEPTFAADAQPFGWHGYICRQHRSLSKIELIEVQSYSRPIGRNAMDFSFLSVRGQLSGGRHRPGWWLLSVTGMGVARVSLPGGRPVPRPAVSGTESGSAAVRPRLARRR